MADKKRRRAHIEEEEEELVDLPEIEVEGKPSRLPVAEEPAADVVEEERRYFIDPQWYEDRGLSFNTVARARFCSACVAKLGSVENERVPVIDPKTKRVTFEVRSVPFGSNPMKTIREDCSRARDYITAETPMLEVLFRIFLANGNQPMPLSTIREHMLTYLPEMAALRSDFPEQLLRRLIASDTRYGMRELKVPAAV